MGGVSLNRAIRLYKKIRLTEHRLERMRAELLFILKRLSDEDFEAYAEETQRFDEEFGRETYRKELRAERIDRLRRLGL